MQEKSWWQKTEPQKKEKKSNTKLIIYSVLLFICALGIVYVLRLPEYQIRKVIVNNAFLTSEIEVQNIVEEYLSYKYFFVVPQSNVYLYPKQKMLQDILNLPSVRNAVISLNKNEKILQINLSEREHEALWCDTINNCYYMDQDGYIFTKSPTFEGNIFLVYKGFIEGDPIGKNYLPEITLNDLKSFISKLKEKGVHVAEINGVSLNEVRLVLKSKTTIIVSLEGDLKEDLKNIEILLESRDFMDATGGIDNLDYIDLRYGKKAFWKAK